MCNTCGYTPCSCPSSYTYNWYNTQTCNPCSTTVICKKNVPARCTFYQAANLANLGLTTNVNIETIFYAIDSIIATILANRTLDNVAQAGTNANILIALNDINSRLNVLEGGSPNPPYTI